MRPFHRHHPVVVVATTFAVLVTFLTTTNASSSTLNITKILATHPSLSTFNHYLTITHLAEEINRRRTITVLVVDNSAMSTFLSKQFSLPTIHNVLSLQILTDYYGTKKLHQLTDSSTLAASVFQSSGKAPGTSGYVNITDHRLGSVTFAVNDAGQDSTPITFVKSVYEHPYDLAVIEISSVLTSPEAEAPVAAPAPINLTQLMTDKGCKEFSNLLTALPDVLATFNDNLQSGLTLFCPVDSAVEAFSSKYKNLTADAKSSLLLYHGLPVYFSIQLLKSNNGVINTLASDGKWKSFNLTVQNNGVGVTLKTGIVTATIGTTVIDQDPDSVYNIDKVLEPRELFKSDVVEAPALSPAAEAPKGSKKVKGGKHASPPAPAGPDGAPADVTAADKAAGSVFDCSWIVTTAAVVAGVVMW